MPRKKAAEAADKKAAPKKEDESLTGPSPISIHLSNAAPPDAVTNQDSLQDLIEKNIKWSQVIYEQNRRIKRRLAWMVFGSYLRLFLILAPIIIGIIYLPEILDSVFGQYKTLFTDPSGGGINAEVLEQALKLFGS